MKPKLAEPVHQILDMVQSETGKPVEFDISNHLGRMAQVKLARQNMSAHIIQYRTDYDNLINHLVAHECGHVLRMFATPLSKRLVPATTEQEKNYALLVMKEDLDLLRTRIGGELVDRMLDMWFEGIVRQLTNMPPDIMIERWLWNNYPDLREFQVKSIYSQQQEAVQALSEEIRRMSPARVYEVSIIMNIAFFRIVGRYLGENFVKPYNNTPILLERGKKLANMTTSEQKDDYEGDIDMINRWADYLGLENWFTWTSFEDVPEDYLMQ